MGKCIYSFNADILTLEVFQRINALFADYNVSRIRVINHPDHFCENSLGVAYDFLRKNVKQPIDVAIGKLLSCILGILEEHQLYIDAIIFEKALLLSKICIRIASPNLDTDANGLLRYSRLIAADSCRKNDKTANKNSQNSFHDLFP